MIELLTPFQKGGAGGGSTNITPIVNKLDEILIEQQNDDNLSELIFKDDSGNTVIRTNQIAEDGTKTTTYELLDGTPYTGIVNDLTTISSSQIITTAIKGCADNVPYTLLQFRTSEDLNTIIASIYRNDTDLTESTTAPTNFQVAQQGTSFVVTAPSATFTTQTQIDVSDAQLLLGKQSIVLTTNLSSFNGLTINANIVADGLMRVFIENNTGAEITLPDLDFRITNESACGGSSLGVFTGVFE